MTRGDDAGCLLLSGAIPHDEAASPLIANVDSTLRRKDAGLSRRSDPGGRHQSGRGRTSPRAIP